MVCGTNDGRLILFENGEQKQEYNLNEDDKSKVTAQCILAFSKGFICGTSTGVIYLYEKSDDKEYYKRVKEMHIKEDNARISCLAISPSEDHLVCTLDTNQIYAISLSNADMKVSAAKLCCCRK